MQETDISEYSAPDIIAQAHAAGYQLIFGEPCPLGRDASKGRGRRTALLVKNDTPVEDITKRGDVYTDYLRSSWRWVERLVPIADGKQIIVASLYGLSGASADATDYISNEKLIAAAIMRMRQIGNVPYFFAGDFNIDPACSKIMQTAIEAELITDIVDDAFGGNPPVTYAKGGITEDMNGPGTIRIDTILTNQAAAHACHNVQYVHQNNLAFDHVPIQVILSYDKFDDYINVALEGPRV